MTLVSSNVPAQAGSDRRSPGLLRRGGAHLGVLALIMPVVILMIPIYAFPTLDLFAQSLGAPDWTFANYRRAFGDPSFLPVMGRTFSLVAQVTLLSALIGYPIAYAMLRLSGRWRKILMILIVLPAWTSVLVRSYSWVVILGREGVLNQVLTGLGIVDEPVQLLYTRMAVVLGLVHVMVPYFVFPLYGVMRRLDLRLVDAAQALGASPRRAFLTVFFPLSLPGVASGAILIFILSIGFFITPALLGGLNEITYVMQIETQVNVLMNWNLAAAMSTVLLAVAVVFVMLFGRVLGFSGGAKATAMAQAAMVGRLSVRLATLFARGRPEGEAPGTPGRRRRGGIGPGLAATIAAAVAFIVVPILLLFPLSFSGAPYLEFPPSSYSLRWYENFFSRPDWTGPAWTSLQVALVTMAASTVLGSLAAVGLSRARFRGSNLLLGFLVSPMIVPNLIIAVGLYFQLVAFHLVGTMTGLVIGHLILATPLVIIIVLNALRGVDLLPERAARSLGAGSVRAFWNTTLVTIRPSIVAAAFFAFLTSFDDVIMALFISGVQTGTLPKRMWDGIAIEVDPTVAAVSTLLVTLSVLLFAVSELARRRGGGAADDLPGGR